MLFRHVFVVLLFRDSSAIPLSMSAPKKKVEKATISSAKKIAFKDLINSIKSAKSVDAVASPLIITCDQPLRIKRTIAWIRDKLFNSQNDTDNGSTHYFFGTELTSEKHIQQIIDCAQTVSLFSPQQFIVVYEADKIKSPLTKNLIAALNTYKLPALIVFTAHEISKTNWLTKLEGNAVFCEIPKLSPQELREWILKEIKSKKHLGGIAEDALTALMTLYTDDMFALSHEVEKLCLSVEPNEQITKNLVLWLSAKHTEKKSFDLFKNIASKNFLNVSFLLAELSRQDQHPLQINALLSRCFRTLLAQKSFQDIGGTPPHTELNNTWFYNNIKSCQSSFSTSDLISAIEVLKNLDLKIKSSSMDDLLEMNVALEKITCS